MKKIVYIFIAFHISLLTFYVNVQQPTQEWVARYPRTGNDPYGPFLALDKTGNSYVAGTHMVNDSNNILCVKYNSSGAQQWATLYKYPGEGFFAPTGLALDSFGNAYITSISSGQSSLGPYNSLLIKFNGITGSVIWTSRYVGQFGDSQPMDFKIDKQNSIYVVGSSDSSHLVIKYNINGDSVWVRKYQVPSAFDIANACVIDDSLNVIITGSRRRCYSMPPPGICIDTLFVAKYSSGGLLRWQHTYGNDILVNVGKKLAVDENGNSYIGGVTRVSGYGVYLTMKYNRNGNLQWTKIYDAPGSGDNGFRSIAMDRINNALFVTGGAVTNGVQMAATIRYNPSSGDSDWVKRDTANYRNAGASDIRVDSLGNLYITGSSNNIPPGGDVDVFSMKYTSIGTKLWSVIYNGPYNGWDGGKYIALDHQNNILVLGTSQSGFQLSDYVLIKYNQILGIGPISTEIPNEFKLSQNYPNPFNGSTQITYRLPARSIVNLALFNMLGQKVKTLRESVQESGNYIISFNSEELSSGVYFLKMLANGNIIDTKKLVLIK